MKNNERNSRKRLNSLILLVAFTAVMLIVSTYAWFSSQKNVTLSGLKGVVNVAEGLQISLDAETWVNTINFNDFDQTNPTAWTVKNTAATQYLATSGATFQSPRGTDGGITNVVPTELLPVSTTGYDGTADGIGENAVKFYEGTNTETIKLMGDTHLVTEDAAAGFFAFDLFVMNTSAGTENDVLQLDPVSDVISTNESAGAQNTARVALALYANDDTTAKVVGGESAATIIGATSTGKTIEDIAIWEPNADKHTNTIVKSAANTLKLDAADKTTYSSLNHVTDATTSAYLRSEFADGNVLPTYALTSGSLTGASGSEEDVHIADVYDWRVTDSASTAAKGVKKQFTLQTNAYADGSAATYRENPMEFVSTKKSEANATTPNTHDNTRFEIGPSQYHKIRVYFWMEGQDPDCINAASLGKDITLNLGFSKPGQDSSGS